ncbi:MAG: tRNA (guanosine(37)-N1)-methyltransferase TrmD [Stomatobaculum sp.]|nr:tRNA (guanosine(37)-N1)-methyltransferase TrmD [Stomatobaculum sp.]
MKISILTVCPELFDSFLHSHEVRRAAERSGAEVEVVDIREFSPGSFRHIDDSPCGGGRGMVLRCQPVVDAIEAVKGKKTGPDAAAVRTILLSPAGSLYDQKKARELADVDHLILVCGHYEGFDARIYPYADELVSVGDYILTGGELPAMMIADSVLRLLEGNLKEGGAGEESFENGLLEYPQYTQPAEFRGAKVPEVLRSGNHEEIRKWRLKMSLKETLERRPELLEGRKLTEEEEKLLEELKNK